MKHLSWSLFLKRKPSGKENLSEEPVIKECLGVFFGDETPLEPFLGKKALGERKPV